MLDSPITAGKPPKAQGDAGFHIAAIVGSLRKASYNRMLLRAVRELAPERVAIDELDIRLIPFYDGDVEEIGLPEAVQALKAGVRAADAVVLISPEYNHSVPGVLKNALDWVTRPPRNNPLRHKPVALMGATIGGAGTVRGQLAMRQVLQYTQAFVMPTPEVLVSFAHERFDTDGYLHHQPTRANVQNALQAFLDWIATFHPTTADHSGSTRME